MIMGGFGGKFFSDSWDFNANENTLKTSATQLGRECFPFAVPTLSDLESKMVYTVDWKTMQILQFAKAEWKIVKKIKE